MTLLIPVASFADDYYYDYIKIVRLVVGEKQAQINDQQATMDQPVYVKNGRTLVPLRFLGEALGSKVNWDSAKNQATLQLGKQEVKVTIGSKVAYVNGNLSTLDVPAETKGGRTFIPLRFVSEALGSYVHYDAETEAIAVCYVDTSSWLEFKFPGETEIAYTYPSDWKMETDSDGIPTFTSPKGSEVTEFILGSSLSETITVAIDGAAEAGYSLVAKEAINPDEPQYGVCLTFKQNASDPRDPTLNFVYLIQLDDSNTRVIDSYFTASNLEMDSAIVLEIIGGF